MTRRPMRPDMKAHLKRSGKTWMQWSVLVGVNHMTVYGWLFRGAKPHEVYLEKVRAVDPECPLLKKEVA